jgi:hypothetical protein
MILKMVQRIENMCGIASRPVQWQLECYGYERDGRWRAPTWDSAERVCWRSWDQLVLDDAMMKRSGV